MTYDQKEFYRRARVEPVPEKRATTTFGCALSVALAILIWVFIGGVIWLALQ